LFSRRAAVSVFAVLYGEQLAPELEPAGSCCGYCSALKGTCGDPGDSGARTKQDKQDRKHQSVTVLVLK